MLTLWPGNVRGVMGSQLCHEQGPVPWIRPLHDSVQLRVQQCHQCWLAQPSSCRIPSLQRHLVASKFGTRPLFFPSWLYHYSRHCHIGHYHYACICHVADCYHTSVGGTAAATSVITTSVTITSAVNVKREIGDSSEPTSLTVINGVTAPALFAVPSISTQVPQKRALSTPNVLTKYLGSIVTSACSLAIKPVTSTNTVTVASTQTANTVLITQQSSVTTLITSSIIVATTTTTTQVLQCTPAYKFVVTDGPRAGQHIIEAAHSAGAIDDGLLELTSSATAAGKFILGTDGQVQSSDGQYVWTTRYIDVSFYILAVNTTAQSAYGLASVLCSIVSPAPAGVTGAIGTLSCQNGGSQVHLITASQRDIYLMQTDTPDSTEAMLTVAVVPVVSCS
jgi:hypothetical protein